MKFQNNCSLKYPHVFCIGRARRDALKGVSFCLLILYAYICTCKRWNFKKTSLQYHHIIFSGKTKCLSLNLVFSYKDDKLYDVSLKAPVWSVKNLEDVVSHSRFQPLSKILDKSISCCCCWFFLPLLFFISAGVISKDSSEFDAITFALNTASAFSNITLRTFKATEPATGLCEQGKIRIRSDQELTLEVFAS